MAFRPCLLSAIVAACVGFGEIATAAPATSLMATSPVVRALETPAAPPGLERAYYYRRHYYHPYYRRHYYRPYYRRHYYRPYYRPRYYYRPYYYPRPYYHRYYW